MGTLNEKEVNQHGITTEYPLSWPFGKYRRGKNHSNKKT